MLLKTVIFFCSLIGTSLAGSCYDNGDKEIKGLCFKFVPQKLTYEDARNWCHYQNPVTSSNLAYVPDLPTCNFLASYARTSFGVDSNFWIGLSRNTSSSWIWDNGQPLTFSNWDFITSQNFATESTTNGKWNPRADTEKNFFVCSYDPQSPPTFAPPASTMPSGSGTTTPVAPTTTEEYDEFCNIGEKHSTFLIAYAADFDVATFSQMKQVVVQAVTANRHNYTKLAVVRFDTSGSQDNIAYYDDVQTFSAALDKNPPNPNAAASPSTPSNVLSIISSFLSASGRPLESSMVLLLVNRFPATNTDLTSNQYDTITNNNVKIFPIISDTSYTSQFSMAVRSAQVLNSISANSNSHFVIGKVGTPLVQSLAYLMKTAYLNSLAVTRSFVDNFGFAQSMIGKLRVPHSETASLVNFTITISAQTLQNSTTNTAGLSLAFYQSPKSQQTVKFEPGSLSNTNFYYATVQLKQGTTYQVQYKSQFDLGTISMIRVWTESTLYHYGSYASLEDPMGGNTLDKVDEYQGAALRMKLMNDCYSTHAGYALFTDCNGVVSTKYDASQTIGIDYIFADEGSFPHYPIVPFFCDSTPKNAANCIPGTQSKYDIQFVAGEFTVIRSFQCRPGVGQISANCKNVDANGNYYCNRDKLPYMRGPTGQIPDCLGHGHVEYDFADAEAYICVCDDGYSGDSCEKH